MNSSEPAIELKGLSYSFTGDWTWRPIEALRDLNLTVYSGESFGFLGHNGAGKTTTIKCILGLLRTQPGQIKLFGREVGDSAARSSVGYLPEQPYFYDHLTVRELMMMYGTLVGLRGTELGAAVDEALELVKLRGRAKSRMRTLSKGLTQRVALAQAILGRPRLLILDEPFSGLDPIGRKEFADLLLYMKEQDTTIFMSSHILSDVEFLCERASIMVSGALKGVFDLQEMPQLQKGSWVLRVRDCGAAAAQLIEGADEAVRQERLLRLSYSDRERAQQALALAAGAGVGVESFGCTQTSLEDLFVHLVVHGELNSEDNGA